MDNCPIINRKNVKQNRELMCVQKKNKKVYEKIKCKIPKASIPKLVSLRKENNYIDMIENDNIETIKVNVKDADEFIAILRKAGLKGQSGNGFPTADKLKTFNESKAEKKSLLINGVECDPGLIHDEWLMKHNMNSIKRGIEVLKEVFKIRDVVLAVKKTALHDSRIENGILRKIFRIKDVKPEVKNAKADLQGDYMVKYVPDRYPMGAERLLIQQALEKNIESDDIPAKIGILVLNVQTVFAIGQIADGTYEQESQYITVANMKNGDAVVARVQRGMKISEIAAKAFGYTENNGLIAGGGIMMAHTADKQERVDEKTFFIAIGESVNYDDTIKCKKCGRCTKNCPAGLQIMKMINKKQKDINADISEYNPERCLKCGTCTYFCYAGKNVMNTVSRG